MDLSLKKKKRHTGEDDLFPFFPPFFLEETRERERDVGGIHIFLKY